MDPRGHSIRIGSHRVAQRSGHGGLGSTRLRNCRRQGRADPAGGGACDLRGRNGRRRLVQLAQGDRRLPPSPRGLMGILYRFMYAVGFTPWDSVTPKELIQTLAGPDAMPIGRALDLGSGMGGKSIYMAAHGWKVTGIDLVPKALREARRRADKAGVAVDFRLGDVTRLEQL